MWLRTLLAGALLAGLLSACAVVDPVDSRYDTVSRSLAKARDEAIFLNLIRASHDYPLSFTTIANVTPTMTNTSSFALPSFSSGPPNCVIGTLSAPFTRTCSFPTGVPGADVVFGNTTASNATAVGTNFNVSTEETGSFYDGFLKPIDLITLNYFIRQGYPRELLFWLFADSFQLGPPGPAAIGYYYNPPVTYGCPRTRLDPKQLCFKEWVMIAVISGLTVEEQTIEKPSGGGGGGGGSGKGGNGGGAKGPETTIVPRFCFSPLLAHKAEIEMGPEELANVKGYLPFNPAHARPICGTPWNAEAFATRPQPDTFVLTPPGVEFRIVPRSAYGVFEFLGNVMKVERENLEPLPSAYYPRIEETHPPKLWTTLDPNLITITQNTNERCFSHSWFYDGDYCVPESATNTKRIFSLLSQLIAIQTQASDLSITPIVRVIQ